MPEAAVAIARMRQFNNTHAGIAYRVDDESNQHRLLHLAWHKYIEDQEISVDLRCKELEPHLASAIHYIEPNVDVELLQVVSMVCRHIARSKPKIAYGLSYQADGCFEIVDGRPELNLPEERRWLNCSTFVLTIFKSGGATLLDPSGWQVRPAEDRAWQEQLISMLKSTQGVEDEHIERIRPGLEQARIRPEETAGSALIEILPASFQQCEPSGKLVMSLIDNELSLLPRPKTSETKVLP